MVLFSTCLAFALVTSVFTGPLQNDLSPGYGYGTDGLAGYSSALAGETHASYKTDSPEITNLVAPKAVTNFTSYQTAPVFATEHAASVVTSNSAGPAATIVSTPYHAALTPSTAHAAPIVATYTVAPEVTKVSHSHLVLGAAPVLSAGNTTAAVTKVSTTSEGAPDVSGVGSFPALTTHFADPDVATQHPVSAVATVPDFSTISEPPTLYRDTPDYPSLHSNPAVVAYATFPGVNGVYITPEFTHASTTDQAAPAAPSVHSEPSVVTSAIAPANAKGYGSLSVPHVSRLNQDALTKSTVHDDPAAGTSAALSDVTKKHSASAVTKFDATFQHTPDRTAVRIPPALSSVRAGPIGTLVHQCAPLVSVGPATAKLRALPTAVTHQTGPGFAVIRQAPGSDYGFGVGSLDYNVENYGYGHSIDSYDLNYNYGLGSLSDYVALLRKKK